MLYAFRSDYDLFQIELSKNYGTSEWHDDLKKMMMKAGMDNVPMVFLFSDTQARRFPNSVIACLQSDIEWYQDEWQ